ncbi:ATP-dependent helicase HrpB [Kaistia geumhonensis]|uniref:ATP-dependent helicase HrpB n=1 Tax=Kaistia geumhonensis TaxID=410839 RepID=A0ABU0M6Q7_9HYPH|nr:ATP-dependent helicase HrpB [Kaistia geumhonensis]MCX5478152.1 ATP-dependent helicase HrpB [Kaistia geumhonensis]MDQ0516632.1 ATP-dependent helicase HrpB [Kaistia geumhonensis]
MTTAFPVDEAIPALTRALADGRNAVLVAPPGAGKTTRVPLALLAAPWRDDRRIILLEPRRLAARAAAARMAATLGEAVGATVGYRVRLERRVSAATRIEVVTEGVFSRMIIDDPSLEGIAAVIFDEFHERSLEGDLGLALALDAQAGLREDLRILVMSATIDGARVARLLGDAPVVESAGRMYPVQTRYCGRDAARRIEDETAAAVRRALAEESGSLLVFLPGQAEIRRTAERLSGVLPGDAELAPLYGALDAAAQDRAIRPAPAGRRKVVLATSIAETSLTIEGVRVVVDSGLARVPLYEPATGITRLETRRVSRASADQRRGRAGRTAPGVCYRLWDEAQTAALAPFDRPEILDADLSPFALDLKAWGVGDPGELAFLDAPPRAAFDEALALLRRLGAIDEGGQLTAEGRALSRLAMPPRLGHMLNRAAPLGFGAVAGGLAALLAEPGLGGNSVDLRDRLQALRTGRDPRSRDALALGARFARAVGAEGGMAPEDIEQAGLALAFAFPERIAMARGAPGAFVMANGRGGLLDAADPLAREPFLAVASLQGAAENARILAAAPLTLAEIEAQFKDAISEEDSVAFDASTGSVRARRVRRLGRLVLAERQAGSPSPEAVAAALVAEIRRRGIAALPFDGAAGSLRARIAFLRRAGDEDWPDLSDRALGETLEDWLGPHLVGVRRLDAVDAGLLHAALSALVPWDRKAALDRLAPTHFEAPSGSRLPIDYRDPNGPVLEVRVQELFGLDRHPAVGNGVPLTLHLLSPARRPIQITGDLPAFWRGSWRDVRADLRGRYPKHPWPEDPLTAPPTARAKPRGT